MSAKKFPIFLILPSALAFLMLIRKCSILFMFQFRSLQDTKQNFKKFTLAQIIHVAGVASKSK